MKLNIKLVLLTTTVFVVALLAIGALDILIIRPAFKQLEQTQALEDSARARAAIDNELQQLGQTWSPSRLYPGQFQRMAPDGKKYPPEFLPDSRSAGAGAVR